MAKIPVFLSVRLSVAGLKDFIVIWKWYNIPSLPALVHHFTIT